MEKQTDKPTKYALGDAFISRASFILARQDKYSRADIPHVDVIYENADGLQYVLFIENDPSFDVTVNESAIDEIYVKLDDSMLV